MYYPKPKTRKICDQVGGGGGGGGGSMGRIGLFYFLVLGTKLCSLLHVSRKHSATLKQTLQLRFNFKAKMLDECLQLQVLNTYSFIFLRLSDSQTQRRQAIHPGYLKSFKNLNYTQCKLKDEKRQNAIKSDHQNTAAFLGTGTLHFTRSNY